MRINEALQRMKRGQPALGASAGLGSVLAAEILSQVGFDFVLVDNQHGAWDDASMLTAFRSVALGSAVPMTRVEQNDYYVIGRALDRGAMGIVVPMVNSADEAAAAARAVRYPPRGGRSMGPFGTAFLGANYALEINEQVFLAVQIEQRQAVEQAEAILSVDGVDGCWVGPSDLGLSMGADLTTTVGRREHEAAILSVRDACHRLGKVPGIAGTPATARHWLDEGFLFVTVVSDSVLVTAGAPEVLKSLRPS
jgi:4-hydroxy-2-oxoheptanedioate aldolase